MDVRIKNMQKQKEIIQSNIVLLMLLSHHLRIVRLLRVLQGEHFILWANLGQQLTSNYPMVAQLFCSESIVYLC